MIESKGELGETFILKTSVETSHCGSVFPCEQITYRGQTLFADFKNADSFTTVTAEENDVLCKMKKVKLRKNIGL